jgi:LCP family protein required for cell wall assembly
MSETLQMFEAFQTKGQPRFGHSAAPVRDPEAEPTRRKRKRKRRPSRIALITLGSLLCVVILAVVGIFAYLNHTESSIPRLHVNGLAPIPGLDGATFLITTADLGPTGITSAQKAEVGAANLIMLLHTNANGKGGGAVTIPGGIMVDVPGYGTEPIWKAFQQGGPSLLVQTLTQATGISINHYARIDFAHISTLVDAVGGLNVTVPTATNGFGYSFVQGVNHLTGVTAIYYARDPSLSSQNRLERQENLVRTLMTTIADDHLFTKPVSTVHVLNAVTNMLAVDSNFTNSDINSLVKQFGSLSADAATFVTAPTQTVGKNQVLIPALDGPLWTAVKHDSLASFAAMNPSTVTPHAAP